MKAFKSLLDRSSTTATIRRSLGLTQQQLADYLNVLPQRVADAEANRRELAGAASIRQTYLLLLLPPAAFDPAHAPTAALEPPLTPAVLPVPPPALPLTGRARKALSWQHKRRTVEALQLRVALAKRLARAQWDAHIQQTRQAVLAAFADPPPAARTLREQVPDDDPLATATLQELLAILFRQGERRGGPLGVTLAHDQLRLYLLEAEAATLAQWLAPEPTQ